MSVIHSPIGDREIELLLSEPTCGAVETVRALDGDFMVLGVGGKMGTTLALMLRRALDAVGKQSTRVFGVSRFSRPETKTMLAHFGVEPISCDLEDYHAVMRLPEAENIEYLAGQKFGTKTSPDETWVQNTVVPSHVAHRFRKSRIVVFSTGCVYPFMPVEGPGASEATPMTFLGEYASTCVGRERVFTHYSRKYSTKQLLFRLNYAVELRYGVLVDIGQSVLNDQPIDITMNIINVIWQGDACAWAIQCLQHVASPPTILNATGSEKIFIKDIAVEFGKMFGKTPIFEGAPALAAWHSDASESIRKFGPTTKPFKAIVSLVADHLRNGGRLLGKPTHFEDRNGVF